jgi:CheY-like chemotaxis protein
MTDSDKPTKIMLIDDNPADLMLVQEVMNDLGNVADLDLVTGGAEALVELRSLLRQPQIQKPCLILLDLNMPSISGLEVLAYIKSQPNLQVIKTVILSTSDAKGDKVLCFASGADDYLVKPSDYGELRELMKKVTNEAAAIKQP